MITQQLFEQALNIQAPWFIKDIEFEPKCKRLDIHIYFRKGSTFRYECKEENSAGDFKVYDTQVKQWKHLNFFEHECYPHARARHRESKLIKSVLGLFALHGLDSAMDLRYFSRL
jgi:hypothetical protein